MMAPPEHAPRDDRAAPAGLLRRAMRRVRRFFFEQEPGFLPTSHLDDDAGEG
jgi:hypothetical protein